MTSFIYNAAKVLMLQGGFDFEHDAFKVALVGPTYLADQDAHQVFADISAEVSGSGYTAGGKALGNLSLTRDDDNDLAVFTADSLSWTVASFIARAAVIYKDSGDPATSPLLAYIDFDEELAASGEDFLLQWHEDGLITLGD